MNQLKGTMEMNIDGSKGRERQKNEGKVVGMAKMQWKGQKRYL